MQLKFTRNSTDKSKKTFTRGSNIFEEPKLSRKSKDFEGADKSSSFLPTISFKRSSKRAQVQNDLDVLCSKRSAQWTLTFPDVLDLADAGSCIHHRFEHIRIENVHSTQPGPPDLDSSGLHKQK